MSEKYEDEARRIGVPLIKPLTPIKPASPDDVVAVCGQCGLHVRRVMGYSCPHQNCPTGMGPTWSMSSCGVR